jgi:hypothetical protein
MKRICSNQSLDNVIYKKNKIENVKRKFIENVINENVKKLKIETTKPKLNEHNSMIWTSWYIK